MIWRAFNRGDAQAALAEWQEGYPNPPQIDKEYTEIREGILKIYETVLEQSKTIPAQSRTDYYIDSHMGLELYEYFWKQPGFSLRTAADDGFWRYLSCKVVPDIVAQRWGKDNDSHFWSNPVRIWLRASWWYIHLSWQGDKKSTMHLIDKSFFTTDTILNFVERSGRSGTYVDVYRKIISSYGCLNEKILKEYKKCHPGKDDLFRVVMKLNTAKLLVMDPALCRGGIDGYVQKLYADTGVNLDVAEDR